MTLPSTWPAHLMVFGEEGLAKLLLTYEAAGGRVWPRLAHHIAERPCVRGGHLRTLRPRLG
uniref:Uncharacterized protein n=1 Tax=Escherichia coli TaxID=562 RepID=A0A5P1MRJ7_ECOLX|nr:hypothetical protein p13ZX28-272_00254 [Escherichia coli]